MRLDYFNSLRMARSEILQKRYRLEISTGFEVAATFNTGQALDHSANAA